MYLTATTWGNKLMERLLVHKHARIFPARITLIHPPPPFIYREQALMSCLQPKHRSTLVPALCSAQLCPFVMKL